MCCRLNGGGQITVHPYESHLFHLPMYLDINFLSPLQDGKKEKKARRQTSGVTLLSGEKKGSTKQTDYLDLYQILTLAIDCTAL